MLDYDVDTDNDRVISWDIDLRDLTMTLNGLRRGIAQVTIEAADRRDEASPRLSRSPSAARRWCLYSPQPRSNARGVLRIINHGNEAGEIQIAATDDYGMAAEPVTLAVEANAAVHFNSTDLEYGNEAKGLTAARGRARATGGWCSPRTSTSKCCPTSAPRTVFLRPPTTWCVRPKAPTGFPRSTRGAIPTRSAGCAS